MNALGHRVTESVILDKKNHEKGRGNMRRISRRNFLKAVSMFAAAGAVAAQPAAASACFVRDEEDLTVWTNFGPVRGAMQADTRVWYGIPYGSARRWQKPGWPMPWLTVRDCTQPAEHALQYGTNYATGVTAVSGTENGLNLDVYAPLDARDLPVLVYIHGGNNQTGSSEEIPGQEIVYNNHCVYVSVDYRLGLFGFNCLPALQKEKDSTGNYALLDIARALDWVRNNIARFGGDPDNVTVSGFSAGGRDVMAMLISPMFAGKFDKAIAFSGGMTVSDEAASARQIAAAIAPLAVQDGRVSREDEAMNWLLTDGDDVREYLYSLDADRIAVLMQNASIRMSAFPHLYMDGVALPGEGFATTAYNAVPLLMLTGSTEFSMFCNFDAYFSGPEMAALPAEIQQAAKNFAREYGSDMYRIFNAQCSAETMYPNYPADIYICQVDYGSRFSPTSIPGLGAFHGVFAPMMTSRSGYAGMWDFTQAGYQAMAGYYNAYLENFLATGDPNVPGQPAWSIWTPEQPLSMVMDADEAAGTAAVGMKDTSTTYAEIIRQMEKDSSVSPEVKQLVISNVMNGRWFSDALDSHFGNPSLWK